MGPGIPGYRWRDNLVGVRLLHELHDTLNYPGKEATSIHREKSRVRTAVAVRFASDASFLPPGNAV